MVKIKQNKSQGKKKGRAKIGAKNDLDHFNNK